MLMVAAIAPDTLAAGKEARPRVQLKREFAISEVARALAKVTPVGAQKPPGLRSVPSSNSSAR